MAATSQIHCKCLLLVNQNSDFSDFMLLYLQYLLYPNIGMYFIFHFMLIMPLNVSHWAFKH